MSGKRLTENRLIHNNLCMMSPAKSLHHWSVEITKSKRTNNRPFRFTLVLCQTFSSNRFGKWIPRKRFCLKSPKKNELLLFRDSKILAISSNFQFNSIQFNSTHGLEFSCTVKNFLCPKHWLLKDFNVIQNCIVKFVLIFLQVFGDYMTKKQFIENLYIQKKIVKLMAPGANGQVNFETLKLTTLLI